MTTLEEVNMITFIEDKYAPMHCINIPEAKFKMGEQVIAFHNGKRFKSFIIMVNDAGDDAGKQHFEYWLKGYRYALWEEEVEHVVKTCKYCGTEQPVENSHCISCGANGFIKE